MQLYAKSNPNQSQALIGEFPSGPVIVSKVVYSCQFEGERNQRTVAYELRSSKKLGSCDLDIWLDMCAQEFKAELLQMSSLGQLLEIESSLYVTRHLEAGNIGSVNDCLTSELLHFSNRTIVPTTITR
jgi:hypothetical protein